MDFGIILKMLIMACGVYMIYWAVQMKTTHQIPQMLVGKGFPYRQSQRSGRLHESYISTYHGNGDHSSGCWIDRSLGGIWCVSYCGTILTLLMLAALVFYGMFLLKAQKRYLIGLDDNNKKIH